MPREAILRSLRLGVYATKRYLFWLGKRRPSRMYRRGRPEDQAFSASEKLYFRCKKDWIDTNGKVKPANVHFPDQSVNRERYSRPTDVLLPDKTKKSKEWILWGVARISVGGVPEPITTAGDVVYSFTAEHDPLTDNYGHTELRAYKNGKRESNKKKINQHVKKEYRTNLALKTKIVVPPLT